MNFGEIIERVRTWRASSGGTEASTSLTYIKDSINSVYREVLSQSDLACQEKEAIIELREQFTDGYLIATQGINVVTLHDTSTYTGFTYQQWGGKLHIGNAGMYYNVVRATTGTIDPALAYLDRPYQSTSTDSVAYSIYSDMYPLPGDCKKIDNCRYGGESGYNIYPKSFVHLDRATVHPLKSTPSGLPRTYAVWKQSRAELFQETCTVTNGSKFITCLQDSTVMGIENWSNRTILTAEGDRYQIVRQNNTALDDPVQLELERPYGGTSATGTVIRVDPVGTLQIQFDPPPTADNSVVLKYQGTDHELVSNSDEPILPPDHHDVVWKGAIFQIAQMDGDAPEVMAVLEREFVRARQRLEKNKEVDRGVVFQRRSWGQSRSRRRLYDPGLLGQD